MTGQRKPPLSAREVRQQTQPRRQLRRRESAIYCGYSDKTFSNLVKLGRLPQPRVTNTGRGEIETWDINELDEAIDRLPHRGESVGTPAAPVRRLFDL